MFQYGVRSVDLVSIHLTCVLIEDGEVLAVPLHGAGKVNGVAGCDRFERTAPFRELDQPEATDCFTVGKEISVLVIAVEVLTDQRCRITVGEPLAFLKMRTSPPPSPDS